MRARSPAGRRSQHPRPIHRVAASRSAGTPPEDRDTLRATAWSTSGTEAGDAATARDHYGRIVNHRSEWSAPQRMCSDALPSGLGGRKTAQRSKDQVNALLSEMSRRSARRTRIPCASVRISPTSLAARGNRPAARDQYPNLMPVFERVLGPQHRHHGHTAPVRSLGEDGQR
jgi:hypothetical protein